MAAALLAPAPTQGLAVQQGADVALFSLTGERVTTLPAMRLDTTRPDPVVVTDADGTRYLLEDGRLQPPNRLRLAAGAELVEDDATRHVMRAGRTRPLGSAVLGWTPDGQPIVRLADGCGRALPRPPGVYVGSRLVVATTAPALLWRSI